MDKHEGYPLVYVVCSYSAKIHIQFHGSFFCYKLAQKRLGELRRQFPEKKLFSMPVKIEDWNLEPE